MPSPALPRHELHVLVVEERREDAHGVGSSPHARDDGTGQTTVLLEQLRARLAPDHGLEVADESRERVGPDDGANDVMGGRDVRDPVAQRLVGGVL